jgi:membrane protease YdiL (CAAX protease family)
MYRRLNFSRSLLRIIMAMAVLAVVINVSAGIVAHAMTGMTIDRLVIHEFVLTYMTGAITEELVYRGLIFTLVVRHYSNHQTAIWLSALVFALVHLPFGGRGMVELPDLILGGVILAEMFRRTGSLTVPTIAHIVDNLGRSIFFMCGTDCHSITAESEVRSFVFAITSAMVSLLIWFLIVRFVPVHACIGVDGQTHNAAGTIRS